MVLWEVSSFNDGICLSVSQTEGKVEQNSIKYNLQAYPHLVQREKSGH